MARSPQTQVVPSARALETGENWAVFVDRVASGVLPVDAAALAGYESPAQTAAELLRLPRVRKALAAAIDARLLSEAAPLGLKVALDILKDEKAPASIRGKMAIAILDRTKDTDKGPAGGEGQLGTLSQGALERLVSQLQQSGAVVVPLDVTPG